MRSGRQQEFGQCNSLDGTKPSAGGVPRRRKLRAAGMVGLALVAMLAAAADFTWTGGGTDDYYDNCANWGTCPSGGYPSTTSDRAIFPWDSGQDWTVPLITEDILELAVEDNTEFTSDDETITFTSKLTVDAEDGGIEVTVTSSTIILIP